MPIAAIVDPKPSDYREARVSTAYLERALLQAAEVHVGDVVRVSTTRGRSALVRVAGVHPSASTPPRDGRTGTSTGLIRFDRFTRQALKAYPHEGVSIERVEPLVASEVVLVPGADVSLLNMPNLIAQIKHVLSGDRTPLREGALLYLRLPDSLAGMTFEVHSVTGGEGVFTEDTALYLEVEEDHTHADGTHQHEGSPTRAESVLDTTYEDVGGLAEQIRTVREFVELPLLFPQVYRQLGLQPPRGVIFHGAPGTGKTLLARSVANEINAHFYSINGPEIVGSYSGQTEENLRAIFREASVKPPAIIFIDELDAIAPRRGTASTLSDSRVVTQLLALMDGMRRAESVMVIGTTNRLETVEPALRRAGRFDREVHFPTPADGAREEILRVHTREMPLVPEAIAALPAISSRAYGFVGADLMELAREAGLNALRRAAGRFLDSPSVVSYPSSEELVVTREDFDAALERVRPAALRESLISYPRIGWSDVGGLGRVKKRLYDLVERPLRHPELFARFGLSTHIGVLLHGPPGTGKTLLAKAIARESGANFIAIQGPELLSQWLGESEESIRRIFGLARRAAPCIVFFDQLDAIAARRTAGEFEGTRAPQRVVGQLLAELDGMEERSQVIVIGATNNVAIVDPSMLRPGRFGVHLHIGLPDDEDRAEILRIHLRSVQLAPHVDREALIAHVLPRSAGLSGADLAQLCQSAKLNALDEAGFDGQPAVRPEHFDAALAELGTHQGTNGAPLV
ncbi:MAG: AAA family ATPase [Chloroflexi bacterium]|nr:AAA family ATPase [Chloroflexota bacterium]